MDSAVQADNAEDLRLCHLFSILVKVPLGSAYANLNYLAPKVAHQLRFLRCVRILWTSL